MDALMLLIPAALFLGFIGLGAFLWALRSGQFEDLDGAAMRILNEDDTSIPPSIAGQSKKDTQTEKNTGK